MVDQRKMNKAPGKIRTRSAAEPKIMAGVMEANINWKNQKVMLDTLGAKVFALDQTFKPTQYSQFPIMGFVAVSANDNE